MPPAIGYWPMCNGRYLFCVDWKGEHFSFSLSQDCKIALRGIKETCNALSLNGNNNNQRCTQPSTDNLNISPYHHGLRFWGIEIHLQFL